VVTKIAQHSQQTTSEEQQLYDHLLHWVQIESPRQKIERFRNLFVVGLSYDDPAILNALDKITGASYAEPSFKLFLTRCCYILINRWQARPQDHSAIPELISLFSKPITYIASGLGRSRAIKRLRLLIYLCY